MAQKYDSPLGCHKQLQPGIPACVYEEAVWRIWFSISGIHGLNQWPWEEGVVETAISIMIFWALLTSLTRICAPVSTWIYDVCLVACCILSLSLKYLGQAIVIKTKRKTKIEVIVSEWGIEFRAKIYLSPKGVCSYFNPLTPLFERISVH